MLSTLLALATTAALARTPDPYVGCRAEPQGEGTLLHRCPGLMMTEAPGPAISPPVAVAALRDQLQSAGRSLRDSTLTIDGDPLPVVLVEGPVSDALVAAVPFPGQGLRILYCAPSDRTQTSLQRCADLVGRASRYGLGVGGTMPEVAVAAPAPTASPLATAPSATPPTATATAALTRTTGPANAPATPDRFSPTDPAGGPVAATGPSPDGPRFRGRDVPGAPDCRWSMVGEDVGSLSCPGTVLVIGRVPVADPSVTLKNLVDPHLQAIKESGFSGRIKRITGPCRVDLVDGQCVDLRLDPPRGNPYRVLAGVVVDRGNTWFATCRQTPPAPGIPTPCDRLLSAWPPVGVVDR